MSHHPLPPRPPPTTQDAFPSTFQRSNGGRPPKPTNHDTTTPPLPTIVFSTQSHLPVEFISSSNKYYLCPDCLRLHETRYCSGRTQRQWEICAAHKDLYVPCHCSDVDCCETDPKFEKDDLKYFRDAVQSGSLLDPTRYQSSATSSVDEAQLNPQPRQQRGQNRYQNRRISSATSASSASPTKPGQPTTYTNVKTTTKLPAIREDYPQTVFTYLHDDKAGCNYSADPSQLMVNADAVKVRDDEKLRRMDRIRQDLQTLERGNGGSLSALLGTHDASMTNPSKDATKDDETTPKKSTITEAGDLKKDLPDGHGAVLCVQKSLLAEYRCLEGQVDLLFETKATFTKRCNVQFVNVLGEVILPDAEAAAAAAAVAAAKAEEEKSVKGREVKEARQEPMEDSVQENVEGGREEPTGEGPGSGSDSDTETGSSASSNTIVPAHITSTKDNREDKPNIAEVDSTEKQDIGSAPTYNPDSIDMDIDSESESKPNEEKTTVANNNVLIPAVDKDVPSTPPATTTSNPEPKMLLRSLLAREALYHEGRATEENFIITCWAMNGSSINNHVGLRELRGDV